MKLVFNLDNEKMREKYLNRLPDGYQHRFSEIIQNENKSLKQKAKMIFEYFSEWHYHKHISHQIDWIDRNWDKLTNFYEVSDIPKTNNVQDYFLSSSLLLRMLLNSISQTLIQNWSKEVSKIKIAWKTIS